MTTYALIRPDGQIATIHDFGARTPAVLAASKGRWLPYNPPAYDADTHELRPREPVNGAATEVQFNIIPLSASERAKALARRSALNAPAALRASPFARTLAASQPADIDAAVAGLPDLDALKGYVADLAKTVSFLLKREMLD